jgi:hypothetical protein
MGIFALYFLIFRVAAIFTGFTFTDVEDFGPILSLLIGLLGAVLIHRAPHKRTSLPYISLMLLLSAWPLLPNFGLFFMARELQSVSGTWPQVMIDDPKNWYGHATPEFDALFHLINYLEAFSGAWMIVFVALFFAAKARLSSAQRRLLLGLTFISFVLALCDPGHLYAWWLD